MNNRNIDIVFSVLFFSLSCYFIYSTSINFLIDGKPLFSQFTQDKTASYIRVVSYFMGFLSIVLLVKTIYTNDIKVQMFCTSPKRFFSLLGAIIVYILVLPYIGFFIATSIFLPLTMLAMGYRRLKVIILSCIGILAFVYLLFVELFGVPLPELTIF